MSGIDDGTPDPEMLAAEYVLGTLDATEAEAARARIEVDGVFQTEVRTWERYLFPLTALVTPVAPPQSLWTRIEDSTGGTAANPAQLTVRAPANDRGPGAWRTTALAALAAAAVLAAFIVLRPASPTAFAVLVPKGSTAAVLVALAGSGGAITIRPSGMIQIASGRDLELWSLAAGATRPVSLGVLPIGGKLVPGVPIGTTLLVSMEPKGGSPSGQPTGPVVYGGALKGIK